jgi:hypothetical protein
MNVPDRQAVDEANRLYWETDASVAEIADRLGWSRRALYDAIRPLPADAACDVCGSTLVFVNRSARSAATTTCMTCVAREEEGAEGDEDTAEDVELARAYAAEARDRRERIMAAGVAGLIGASIGAAVAFLVVRRD